LKAAENEVGDRLGFDSCRICEGFRRDERRDSGEMRGEIQERFGRDSGEMRGEMRGDIRERFRRDER